MWNESVSIPQSHPVYVLNMILLDLYFISVLFGVYDWIVQDVGVQSIKGWTMEVRTTTEKECSNTILLNTKGPCDHYAWFSVNVSLT